MKKRQFHLILLIIISYALSVFKSYGQIGNYGDMNISYQILPNNIFIEKNYTCMGLYRVDSGSWIKSADTIFLFDSKNQKRNIHFYIKDDNLHYLHFSDSVIKDNIINKLNDHYLIGREVNAYETFYDTGEIKEKFDYSKMDTITRIGYYKNGLVKHIKLTSESFYSPVGTWYYFDIDRKLIKTENYFLDKKMIRKLRKMQKKFEKLN